MIMKKAFKSKAKYPRALKPIFLSISAAIFLSACGANKMPSPKALKQLPPKFKTDVNTTKDVEPVEPAVAGDPLAAPQPPKNIEPVTPGMMPIGACDASATKNKK